MTCGAHRFGGPPSCLYCGLTTAWDQRTHPRRCRCSQTSLGNRYVARGCRRLAVERLAERVSSRELAASRTSFQTARQGRRSRPRSCSRDKPRRKPRSGRRGVVHQGLEAVRTVGGELDRQRLVGSRFGVARGRTVRVTQHDRTHGHSPTTWRRIPNRIVTNVRPHKQLGAPQVK